MITLRDLQYLVALEKHRHFSQAADACFVSQPTLSGQFKKLEEYLGLTLVERNRHQIIMTPAGAELAARAQQLIAGAEEFERHARALIDPLSGEMHVGLVPTLAPYLLARVMAPIGRHLPDMQFYLYEEQTSDLLTKLDNGVLDLLLLPWSDQMSCFERVDLFKETLQFAGPSNHPLAESKKLKLTDLEGQHVLTLEDGHCLREDAMSYCFAAGAKEDQRFRATSLETLRFMVSNGIGITLIPQLAIENRKDRNIVYRKFTSPEPSRQISAVFRKGYPRFACVQEIVPWQRWPPSHCVED